MPRKTTRLFVITNCMYCPKVDTRSTPGAGCAVDYLCTAGKAPKLIAGYVENLSEQPQDGKFPSFCPLTPHSWNRNLSKKSV